MAFGRYWLAGMLLIAVGFVGAAVADSTDDESDDAPIKRDEVLESEYYETATVRARPVSHATASVTILDREGIEAVDAVSVAELVQFAAGVNVVGTGPRGGVATAQIRGGDPNYTLVLLDGVPLNDITDQAGGAVNLNSLSAAHIERIEIVRGPLSSFYGNTGLAGAINIITKRGSSSTPDWSVNVAAGDNSTFLGSAALSQGTDEQNYFVGVFWEQAENQIDGGEDKYDQVGLHANGTVRLGRGAELHLTGRVTSWDTEDYADASGGLPPLGSGDLRISENEDVSLGAQLFVGRHDRRHKVWVAGFRHELQRDSPFIFNPGNPAASVPASIDDTTYTSWQLGWAGPQAEFGKSRMNYGIDGRNERGKSDSTFEAPPPFDNAAYRIDRSYGGAFAEWINERGRVLFEVGARVDFGDGFDPQFNPRAGVSYRFSNEQTRLRSSVGRAFKLPSFFALAVPNFGNADLLPETSVGADAGIEHDFGSANVNLGVTLFYNKFKNLVDFDDTTFTHVNVPEVESQGVETNLDWRPVSAIRVHANVTYEDFDDATSADPLTHRPEWYGSAGIVWKATERLRWEVDGQWISEFYDFQVPNDGTQLTSGYQLFGTAASFRFSQNWDVHARVNNLADKAYEPFIGFPGPGRNFRIGLRRQSRR